MELSVILTVHNKCWLAAVVVDAVVKFTRTPFELVVVYDGCTDTSQHAVESVLDTHSKRLGENRIQGYVEVVTPDVHETRANNAGLRACRGRYAILVQDDMVVNECGWDERLMRPMRLWSDVFAVSARNALTHLPGVACFKAIGRIEDGTPRGHYDNPDRNLFRLRQSVNRGPLGLDMEKARALDYLDESFAPAECDDADICWRAFVQHGWRCGVLPVEYLSDLHWGTMRIKAGQSALGSARGGGERDGTGSINTRGNWCRITERYGHLFHDAGDEDRLVTW
jgi:glycosyltransferase involved in cell wall biosynthesis